AHLTSRATEESRAREAERAAKLLPAVLRGLHAERVRPEQLDFPVSEPRDHRERPIEILLERLRHGEQADAEAIEVSGRRRRRRCDTTGRTATGGDGGGSRTGADEELASGRHDESCSVPQSGA